MHKNILLHGIPEVRNKNWSTTREVAIKFLKEQMRKSPKQVDSMVIDRIHQIGRKQENKTYAIAMKLLLSEDKELILLHKKYFRGMYYGVSSKFNPETLAKCKVLKTYMDTEVLKDKKKVISNDKLVVEEKEFMPNELNAKQCPHVYDVEKIDGEMPWP